MNMPPSEACTGSYVWVCACGKYRGTLLTFRTFNNLTLYALTSAPLSISPLAHPHTHSLFFSRSLSLFPMQMQRVRRLHVVRLMYVQHSRHECECENLLASRKKWKFIINCKRTVMSFPCLLAIVALYGRTDGRTHALQLQCNIPRARPTMATFLCVFWSRQWQWQWQGLLVSNVRVLNLGISHFHWLHHLPIPRNVE